MQLRAGPFADMAARTRLNQAEQLIQTGESVETRAEELRFIVDRLGWRVPLLVQATDKLRAELLTAIEKDLRQAAELTEHYRCEIERAIWVAARCRWELRNCMEVLRQKFGRAQRLLGDVQQPIEAVMDGILVGFLSLPESEQARLPFVPRIRDDAWKIMEGFSGVMAELAKRD